MADLFTLYSMLENTLGELVTSYIALYGGFGVLLAMFLESSIVPIPSEAVFVTAGALGINLWTIVIFGTIGSTLGAIVGYYIGLKGGRPVIDKIGHYLFITHEKVQRAENAYKKYGGKAVFISRLIPFIPFKVFSITSGILKLDLKEFVLYTFLGTIPRAFILGWIGVELTRFKEGVYIAIGAILLLVVLYFVVKKYFNGRDYSNPLK